MKEISIPIPGFRENDIAEIEVRPSGKSITYNYRIESFKWEAEDELPGRQDEVSGSLARIHRLKKAISEYDQRWELIQIYTPSHNSGFIQVLYRKKM